MSETSTPPPRIGTCPFCHAEVATTDVIIEYESNGRPAVYAECPGCRDVVNPK
jgi:hypothetical protein